MYMCIIGSGYFPPTLFQPRRESHIQLHSTDKDTEVLGLKEFAQWVGSRFTQASQTSKPRVSLISAEVTPSLKSFSNSSDSRPLFPPVPSGPSTSPSVPQRSHL